ncbi:MAG: hypothetical protein K2X77_18570 [Candidatus Obscuribacterales bacterium]|jgi:hypothetical protein|nr:hypothetical protein [Candidatus Obscuribacterales bacterium]
MAHGDTNFTNIVCSGTITVTGAQTFTGATSLASTLAVTGAVTLSSTLAVTGAVTMASTLAVTGNGTVGGTLGVTGNATLGGTLAVTGAVTLTVPLTAANINKSAKRQVFLFRPNNGGTIADGTTYAGFINPGRAGTVTGVSVIAGTPPVGGTNTVKVLRGSSAGNTMLSAASYDPTGLTANQAAAMTLTATGADLAVAASGANSGIYVEWVAGTQSTDGVNACIAVEFEPTDF